MIRYELTTKGIKFIGSLDEAFATIKIPIIHRPHTQIDLSGITSLNSCGIRDFLGWLDLQNKEGNIEFMNCPVFFVQQANMVGGIITPKRKISTFFVPYFQSTIDKEHHILLNCSEINQGKAPSKELNGEILQIDISEERYFQFLKIQGQ